MRFTLSGVHVGFEHELPSQGDMFSDKQIEFINRLSKGDKVTFSNIYAVGPDGTERELNPIIFKLTGE